LQASGGTSAVTLSSTATVNWTPTQTGSYVLRYAATNTAGTGSNDITVNVTTGSGTGGGTAPVFGQLVSDSGESDTVTAAALPGVAAGAAQAVVILSAGAETITQVPGGWTLWDTATVTSGVGDPGGPMTAWLYTSTTSTATAAWTKSGTRRWHVVRWSYSGQSAWGPHTVTAETSPATTHPTPSVNPARASSLVVGVVCCDRVNSDAGPFTPPAGWTERYDRTVTIGTENLSITIADVAASAATTGTFNSALEDEAAVFALALQGPLSDQVVQLVGIPPTLGLGTLTVGAPVTEVSVALMGIAPTFALGRLRVALTPVEQTVQLKGIPPR
jgi:hypothetical protein